jgi:flagellar hook-basal body complex protein FliE
MSTLPIGHMSLGNVGGLRPSGVDNAPPSSPGEGFVGRLESAVDQVNSHQAGADDKVNEFVAGGDVPVHTLMVELAKADTSMRLMTSVTAKAIQAYQEIARMQI